MELEVYFNNYNQILDYLDDLEKAYKLINQRYKIKISIVCDKDETLRYKVHIKLIPDGKSESLRRD